MFEVVGAEEEIRLGVLEGGGSIWKRTEPDERLDMVGSLQGLGLLQQNRGDKGQWRRNEEGEERKQEKGKEGKKKKK